MGIKHLNKFVKLECPGAINPIALSELSGKVVVVDASIYMYRFLAEQALLEHMYTMISLFQMHGIVPVFIFDGKPPDEKRNTLNRRKYLKQVAEMHYNKVKLEIQDQDQLQPPNEVANANHLLKALKRRFVRLHDADFDRVKTLMRALGVRYIVADGEADALCAQMVLKRKAHACMSDDTDMFVYGCPRVLRHLNLIDETCTMYDMSKILNLLGITMTEFRQICVVSGTDYNCEKTTATATTSSRMHLHFRLTLKLFKQYKKCIQEAAETDSIVATDFYTWLHHNCCTINPRWKFDYNAITAVDEMFNITNAKLQVSFHKSVSNSIDHELLHTVMAHENFIFV
jgi:flap endonuclease-1